MHLGSRGKRCRGVSREGRGGLSRGACRKILPHASQDIVSEG